jgi:predicted metal-dependent hydrolase
MRKPYRRRQLSLYESIEALVEQRNALVHAGDINLELFDNQLQTKMSDLTEAINRTYNHIAKHFDFPPNHNY